MSIRGRAMYRLAFLAAGFGLAATSLPLHLPSVCLFKRLTGLPCATCGMTHSFCAMAHADFSGATAFHLASVPLAGLIAAGAVLLVAEAWQDRRYLGPAWDRYGRSLMCVWLPLLFIGWGINLTHALGW